MRTKEEYAVISDVIKLAESLSSDLLGSLRQKIEQGTWTFESDLVNIWMAEIRAYNRMWNSLADSHPGLKIDGFKHLWKDRLLEGNEAELKKAAEYL